MPGKLRRTIVLLSILFVVTGCAAASTTPPNTTPASESQRFPCKPELPDGALTASSCTALLFVQVNELSSGQKELFAINGFDGSVRWHSPKGSLSSIPWVSSDGETVYLQGEQGTFTPNLTDVLWALNAETGAVRWSRTANA